MSVEIPYFVNDFFKEQIREKGVLIVEVDVFDQNDETKFLYRHGLTFGIDMHFHGANSYTLSINEYLKRLLTYTIKPIKIYVNKVALNTIEPKALPPVITPIEIDLTNVVESDDDTPPSTTEG
jgi:hypothetical protein